ncbi:serine/threonine-protein kinase [Archangium sp.]|uniref:serine/threonine protein kinase n=1 Tax=Archangium sp. TaxID=1872627 RepID=UPI002D2F22E9|nr:serine/threonine-protein kinase [Archangium sp.]HYO54665.1 serine/threonine-protein kinase [Archangium sp.]
MLDGSGGRVRGEIPGPGFAPGTEVAGFIIEGLLANGSFGIVYRARRGGRPFAVKLVPMDPRGNREVDALRRMRHPNVVGFHGYGFWPEEKPRFLVLALELVEGHPLDVWAREMNPSALELVSQVLLPLVLTLADVHAAGVVHRDIKESNIVVRELDRLPVLVDFGAAGLAGAPRLTMRMPPGTPEYRSPEALRFAREWEGEPYPSGPGDDLWAVGVVTYCLLTRTLPFGDRHDPGMARAILQETPPAPHELNPCVPPALSELCMRMLEKEPKARYADARTLAEALATEWVQADRSWRVPLFPGARRAESPAPPPAPSEVPEREAPGEWWLAGLALAAILVVFSLLAAKWPLPTVTPFVQRPESPPPTPPQQASPRQEMAPTPLTGEVCNGAGPQESSTPAPVANATSSEEPEMMKSQTVRSLAATALFTTSSTCVGPGCASAPQQQPPPVEECPPGAVATHKQLNIGIGYIGIFIPPYEPHLHPNVAVSEGDVTAATIGPWGLLPDATPLYGKLFFGKKHLYGRFTRARLESGEIVPICMEIVTTRGRGIATEPGSTSKKFIVSNIMGVVPVDEVRTRSH